MFTSIIGLNMFSSDNSILIKSTLNTTDTMYKSTIESHVLYTANFATFLQIFLNKILALPFTINHLHIW